MTVPEKRLDAAAEGLTAKERAVLILRPWLAGGEGEHRLRKYAPADQTAEIKRIEDAINAYNVNLHGALTIGLEWLWRTETLLAWLECLDGFLRQQSPASARSLPPPGRAFHRDLPILWDRLLDDNEPLPRDWHEARERLVREVTGDLKLRWTEQIAMRRVADELESEMGEGMVHVENRNPAEAIGRKILELQEGLEALVEPIELGLPTEEQLKSARDYVDWDALRPPAPNFALNGDGRPWMTVEERAELEELEARLAAELRARKN